MLIRTTICKVLQFFILLSLDWWYWAWALAVGWAAAPWVKKPVQRWSCKSWLVLSAKKGIRMEPLNELHQATHISLHLVSTFTSHNADTLSSWNLVAARRTCNTYTSRGLCLSPSQRVESGDHSTSSRQLYQHTKFPQIWQCKVELLIIQQITRPLFGG